MSATLVRQVFEPGGLLSLRHPGYEPRRAQIRMSEAVHEAFTASEHLFVEAPPGTGKTFAYLVPAAAAGRAVVISTGTRTLQDQLFRKDIPLISHVLGRRIRAALMKGRENYLCLYRLHEISEQGSLAGLGGEAAENEARLEMVRAWSSDTETGDRVELEGLPEPWPLWERIDARADACLGQRCPQYEPCFLTRMRRRAQEADLIIVNHHLLMSDLVLKASAYGAVIPPYGLLVIDEGHMLEEVATAHLGRGLSSHQIRDLLGDVASYAECREGLTAEERTLLGQRGGEVKRATGDFHERFEGYEGRFLLEPLREEPGWLESGRDLAVALAGLERAFESLTRPTDTSESYRRRASDLSGTLQFLLAGEDEERVMWCERRGRGIYMMASPIDVSPILRDLLFDGVDAVTLTSATLTVDGSFDFILSRLGPARAATLSLESPFDLTAQSVLYLPPSIPDPGSSAFADAALEETLGLLSVTEGRAFLLFTSFASMRRTRAALEGRVPYPLLMQGEASRHSLLESFRRTPHAVLLATASFWQGVDVPGDALSLVVIEKLPFDVPTDPLVAARCEAVRRRGGNPFVEYQIPSAVIDLKQGLGRLLRARTDRGVLAILDGRLRTRRYGTTFLRSLPPYPTVDSIDKVCAFFRIQGNGERGAAQAGTTGGAPVPSGTPSRRARCADGAG